MNSDIADLEWNCVQAATNSVINNFTKHPHSKFLIDLSGLSRIDSGLIASLLRIWKSLNHKTRHFVVVTSDSNIQTALRISGLDKLWSVVDSREDAAYKLGISRKAELEKRELRVLAIGALPFSLLSALALLPSLFPSSELLLVNSKLAALMLAAMSLTTGILSAFKDRSRRILSGTAIIVSLIVLTILILQQNKMVFEKSQPKPPVVNFE